MMSESSEKTECCMMPKWSKKEEQESQITAIAWLWITIGSVLVLVAVPGILLQWDRVATGYVGLLGVIFLLVGCLSQPISGPND